ncbi:MAG TPA: DEAD/DEAH box helicase, partial [Candidatus Limnocylindrales bacterium]|nr:DEAD/DEAH box helicase [Candidatus Limnocylindrales bacterium]
MATLSIPPSEPAGADPGGDPLAPFSPAVRAWFESSFAAPTQAQAEGWAAIANGHHTLIHAPTGSGKTLAAFLWTL